jgi:hypothetical protein
MGYQNRRRRKLPTQATTARLKAVVGAYYSMDTGEVAFLEDTEIKRIRLHCSHK